MNVHQLACTQLPRNQIDLVRFFTARVSARPHDPTQPQRQETYLRALASVPGVALHFGHFLTHEVTMPDAQAWRGGVFQPVRVVKTEEKGSDVNLAAHLLIDAFDDLFDVAFIVSNDSDLKEPIRLVKQRFGKAIGILGPKTTRISGALRPLTDFIRTFGPNALAASQFPAQMHDANGAFHKPAGW